MEITAIGLARGVGGGAGCKRGPIPEPQEMLLELWFWGTRTPGILKRGGQGLSRWNSVCGISIQSGHGISRKVSRGGGSGEEAVEVMSFSDCMVAQFIVTQYSVSKNQSDGLNSKRFTKGQLEALAMHLGGVGGGTAICHMTGRCAH